MHYLQINASSPVNLYGATKLCSDKLFIAANNIKGNRKITFNIVRYGNVLGSRGSVIPLFQEMRNTGEITITDPKMTRFNILIENGVDLILKSLKSEIGGQIFVPKIPSYNIIDLAKAIAPNAKIKYVGIRPGEKLHEEMISVTDSLRTVEYKDYYSILPFTDKNEIIKYAKKTRGKLVKNNFNYVSSTNNHFLKIKEIKKMIDLFENEKEY